MSDLCRLIWCALIGIFRPRAALQAEILVLRHQLIVLRRKSPKRLAFGNVDRLVFTALYHVAPGVLDALKILKPQTVIRWHRAGFRTYWRWKSRPHGGRPPRASVAGCDRTPECRLDRPSTDRVLRLSAAASLHRSRSRLRLWRYRPQTASRNGHTRSADLTTIAMAKW